MITCASTKGQELNRYKHEGLACHNFSPFIISLIFLASLPQRLLSSLSLWTIKAPQTTARLSASRATVGTASGRTPSGSKSATSPARLRPAPWHRAVRSTVRRDRHRNVVRGCFSTWCETLPSEGAGKANVLLGGVAGAVFTLWETNRSNRGLNGDVDVHAGAFWGLVICP